MHYQDSLWEKFRKTRLLAMDVDGVLTDGTIAYDSAGGEQKRFHVADGLGLVLMRQVGIEVAWISGRTNPALERRAYELGVTHLMQGVRDKAAAVLELGHRLGLTSEEIAYIGDDWNDLPVFALVGLRIAVANAAAEVRALADGVTLLSGGQGAVREVCEALLDARELHQSALRDYLVSLKQNEYQGGAGQ
jgi:3-deoxy-D-manno-octulosonate 8-phosphate phosphatase (KDO 8-P phosphatase)